MAAPWRSVKTHRSWAALLLLLLEAAAVEARAAACVVTRESTPSVAHGPKPLACIATALRRRMRQPLRSSAALSAMSPSAAREREAREALFDVAFSKSGFVPARRR